MGSVKVITETRARLQVDKKLSQPKVVISFSMETKLVIDILLRNL